MKQSKPLLFCLLASVMAFCMMPGLAFGDGPWDIDYGGGAQTNGGEVQDRDAMVSGSGGVPGDNEGYAPDLLSGISSQLLRQIGLVKLADSIILKDLETRVKTKRVVSSSRRQ